MARIFLLTLLVVQCAARAPWGESWAPGLAAGQFTAKLQRSSGAVPATESEGKWFAPTEQQSKDAGVEAWANFQKDGKSYFVGTNNKKLLGTSTLPQDLPKSLERGGVQTQFIVMEQVGEGVQDLERADVSDFNFQLLKDQSAPSMTTTNHATPSLPPAAARVAPPTATLTTPKLTAPVDLPPPAVSQDLEEEEESPLWYMGFWGPWAGAAWAWGATMAGATMAAGAATQDLEADSELTTLVNNLERNIHAITGSHSLERKEKEYLPFFIGMTGAYLAGAWWTVAASATAAALGGADD